MLGSMPIALHLLPKLVLPMGKLRFGKIKTCPVYNSSKEPRWKSHPLNLIPSWIFALDFLPQRVSQIMKFEVGGKTWEHFIWDLISFWLLFKKILICLGKSCSISTENEDVNDAPIGNIFYVFLRREKLPRIGVRKMIHGQKSRYLIFVTYWLYFDTLLHLKIMLIVLTL